MNTRQLILLILLTLILLAVFYALLNMIDKHFNGIPIIFFSILLLIDIYLISRLFFKLTHQQERGE